MVCGWVSVEEGEEGREGGRGRALNDLMSL